MSYTLRGQVHRSPLVDRPRPVPRREPPDPELVSPDLSTTTLSRPRARAVRRVVVTFLVLALSLTGSATAQDLEDVVEQREQLETELDQAVAAWEDLVARLATAEEELAQLETRVAALEAEAQEVNAALADRARAAFKRGDGSMLTTMLGAEGPEGALERAQFLVALTGRDRGQLEGATNLKVQLQQSRTLLEDKAAELASLREEMAAIQADLEGRLSSVKVKEAELRSRRERQRVISNGVQDGTYACIIAAPYHFRDTWGHPRSGGRRHKGTDVMGQMNAQVYAFTHGRISRLSNGGLGGISVYLWGDDGVEYFYTHLNGYAPGIHVGKRVEAGEWIALNGNTGNARGGAPHIHFEIHPGGGGAVNPYPWLTPACF